MSRTGVLQEIRMQRFEEIHNRFSKGRLSAAEAADWLGVRWSPFPGHKLWFAHQERRTRWIVSRGVV